jgi:hypothetical protein
MEGNQQAARRSQDDHDCDGQDRASHPPNLRWSDVHHFHHVSTSRQRPGPFTRTRLHQFDEALTNLQAQVGKKPTKLQQLEIDAVTAQADDLRSELAR